jgi:hypothetical protein
MNDTLRKALLPALLIGAYGTSQAEGALDFVDPCIHAREQFDHAKSAILAQFDAARTESQGVQVMPNDIEGQWWGEIRIKMREQFDDTIAPSLRAEGAAPSDAAFERWLQTQIAAAGGKEKVDAMLIEKYRSALGDAVAKKQAEIDGQLKSQQSDLDGSCKMDVGNQALRVTLNTVMTPVAIVGRNLEGAKNEPGVLNQVVHATTGISLPDIIKYGPAGDPHSVVNEVGSWIAGRMGW